MPVTNAELWAGKIAHQADRLGQLLFSMLGAMTVFWMVDAVSDIGHQRFFSRRSLRVSPLYDGLVALPDQPRVKVSLRRPGAWARPELVLKGAV